MKATTLILLSFLIFAFITRPLPVLGDASPDPVLDMAGKILRKGTSYYIVPAIKYRGGGLTLASTGYETCPLDVVQAEDQIDNGIPLTFSPMNPKKGIVRLSTDLNIKFDAANSCPESTVLKVDEYDQSLGQWFVTTGGVEGNPGPKTTRNWFKIEKYDDAYKLVFCPTVCRFCKVQCRDIGIYVDYARRIRRLALSYVPFKVMFKKAW